MKLMHIPENKIVKALCCLAFLTASACIDAVDDYYTGGETATREGSVLEYLEKTPDYSDFVKLVAETGMTETLSGTDLVTVWAPANPMPAGVASMSPSEKIRLVRNHISITTVFSRNLDRLSTVGTLAGKYLTVGKGSEGYTVDGVAFSELDRVFENGVVHRAADWLTPRKNLYQWLEEVGDDYSRFRDTLFAHNLRVFDKENSPITGVDENGRIFTDRFFSEYFNGRTSWRDDFVKGEGYQEAMRCYYAMVNSIDEQFGRVVELLDSLGIADNTIVVFTSDHGEMMTSQGRMFKMIFYDEACRIPFLIRCPGAKRGRTDVCLNTPDIAPTLLGLVGLSDSIPAEMEGDDLSFAVRGGKGLEPDFAFMQGMGHTHLWRNGFEWRAVRDKRYTYARYLRDGSELLFDRQKDPHMTRNVAEDKKYAKVLASLRSGMAAKMEELNNEFKPCTWYRDHWMYKDFSIKAAAHGEFGPLPPIEPVRVRK